VVATVAVAAVAGTKNYRQDLARYDQHGGRGFTCPGFRVFFFWVCYVLSFFRFDPWRGFADRRRIPQKK
jgi:hypothetical protein